jgi:predicted aspartyl protease
MTMNRIIHLSQYCFITFLMFFNSVCSQNGTPFTGGTPVFHSSPVKITFKLNGHRIYIPVMLNHSGKSLRFLLDTGAFTSIDQRTADELGLHRGASLDIEGKIKSANLLREKVTLRLGAVEVRNFKTVVMDYSIFHAVDPDLRGFLGSDFLKYFYVSLDYQKKELILDRSPFPVPAGSYRIQLDTRNEAHLPRVKCRINDRWLWPALIDTGAPFALVLPLKVVESEGWRISPLIESKGVAASWPHSQIDKNYLGRLHTVVSGELKLTETAVIFSNTDDVIWGHELLSQFRVLLHYPENELILIPKGKIQLASNFFSVGLKLIKTPENKTMVAAIWKGSSADLAGIAINSEVLSLNGKPAQHMSINEINLLLNSDRITAIEMICRKDQREKKILLKKAPLLPED